MKLETLIAILFYGFIIGMITASFMISVIVGIITSSILAFILCLLLENYRKGGRQ